MSERRGDLAWIAFAVFVLIGTGVGMRDPWPADEPRFATLAQDLVRSGDWLFPRVGGDLYQDKPPLYFWLSAAVYAVLGSVKWSFLLPSLGAAFGTLALVYDWGRRIASRQAGLAAALTLATTVQFVMAMRGAQIDPTLCFLITLSLYGLLRHLVFGPQWGWWTLGGVAAGLGVLTKGVGFLPLLVILPYVALRCMHPHRFVHIPARDARWGLAILGLVAAVSMWLVPMLWAAHFSGDAALVAYRDEILFHQTIDRYASAWHHVRPWRYFLVDVIPGLWLPWSLLLVWLARPWWSAWQEKRVDVVLPLIWVILVVAFFSSSGGKRGIYVLPALPALAMAAAPFLPALYARASIGRLSLLLGGALVVAAAILVLGAYLPVSHATRLLALAGLESAIPILVFALAGGALWIACSLRRPLFAWPAVLGMLAVVFSYTISPAINGLRSGATFTRGVNAAVPGDIELGLVDYKEQFLLYLDRPVVTFGHRRWREGPAESYDAAIWLAQDPKRRALLVSDERLAPCFASASSRTLAGITSGERWWLVQGEPQAKCVRRGNLARAIAYMPANTR